MVCLAKEINQLFEIKSPLNHLSSHFEIRQQHLTINGLEKLVSGYYSH